jgi:hypothetical protein
MAGKKQKIKRRWVKFLENLRDGMTETDAYLAAGYKSRSRESAARSGSRLLIKLREIMHGTEMFDIYVPADELSRVGAELLRSKDDRVRAAMFGHAAKVKRWVDPENDIPHGVTVVIDQRPLPPLPEEEERLNEIKPIKYRQITD